MTRWRRKMDEDDKAEVSWLGVVTIALLFGALIFIFDVNF